MALTLLGHGNCAQIVPISSYEVAKQRFESTKPLRGRTPELKPLGRMRRYTWYTIQKNTYANQAENTQYDTYACRLFDTDCVEFYPNGDVTLRSGGWRTITTGAFITYSLYGLGSVVSESGKWYFSNSRNQAIRWKGHELKLKLENGVLVPKEPLVQEYIHRVNRKAMNALRKKYRPIVEYASTMLAIEPTFDRLALEDAKLGIKSLNLLPRYNWIAPNVGENRSKVFQLMDEQLQSGDLELLYDLARYVATNAGSYNYRLSKFVCYPQNFVKTFDEMLKHEFRDEVFDKEPVELGVMFNDRNKKYFQ